MSSRILLDAGPGANPPVEEPQRTPAEAPERREPEPAQSPPPAETPSPEPAEDGAEPPKEDALQKRLDRLNWEKHEAIRQRDLALSEHQRFVEQLQRQNQPPVSSEYERGRQEAEQARVAGDFNKACDNLFNRGVQEYGAEMGEARDRLLSVGYDQRRPDILAAITQLPDGHRVYRELARDLDHAARVLSLPPMQMALELARMSSSENVPREQGNSAYVSRAPEPVSRIGGQSGRSERPLDDPKTSMAEYIRRRDAMERRSRILR